MVRKLKNILLTLLSFLILIKKIKFLHYITTNSLYFICLFVFLFLSFCLLRVFEIKKKHKSKKKSSVQEESHSTPTLLTSGSSVIGNSAASLALIPEHTLLESCARLSVSLEGTGGLYNPGAGGSCSTSTSSRSSSQNHMTNEELEELRAVNRYAESTKSLSYLPQVGRQSRTARLIRHFTTI